MLIFQMSLSPSICFIYFRWLLAAFANFCFIYNAYSHYQRHLFGFYFIYQTHLNLVTSSATLTFGAILATKVYKTLKISESSLKYFQILWLHCATWAFCTTLVYWFGLYRGNAVTFSNLLGHGLNSIPFLLDILLSTCKARRRSSLFTLIYSSVYLIFTVIYSLSDAVNK